MAHELDMTLGSPAMAYIGETPWHRLGVVMPENASIDSWLDAAGLNWTVKSGNAYYYPMVDGHGEQVTPVLIPNCKHWYRSDTGQVMYTGTDQFEGHQPREIMEFFNEYVLNDPRFRIETAGALKDGRVIWALARFQHDLTVAGDAHTAYVLLTTSFDGSMATTAQATMVRVVCNNTLTWSMQDKRAVVKIRHTSKFDESKRKHAASELAAIAGNFTEFKSIGDGMAQQIVARDQVSAFFRDLLDIPRDASADDITTRKANQFDSLCESLMITRRERGQNDFENTNKFELLNAATRYVDHARASDKKADDEKLFVANFGSGASLKTKAMALLQAA